MSEEVTPVIHEPDCVGFPDDHARAEGICASMCMGCMECEPTREDDFKYCGECLHVFRTPKELVDAHMEVMKRVDPHYFVRPAATDIYLCPVCNHDF